MCSPHVAKRRASEKDLPVHATVTEAISFSNQNSDTVWFSDHDFEQKIEVVIILLEFWSEKQIAWANIELIFIIYPTERGFNDL